MLPVPGAGASSAVPEGLLPAVEAAAAAEDVPYARIGTTGGDLLVVTGTDILADGAGSPLILDLDELRSGVEATLPALFD